MILMMVTLVRAAITPTAEAMLPPSAMAQQE